METQSLLLPTPGDPAGPTGRQRQHRSVSRAPYTMRLTWVISFHSRSGTVLEGVTIVRYCPDEEMGAQRRGGLLKATPRGGQQPALECCEEWRCFLDFQPGPVIAAKSGLD